MSDILTDACFTNLEITQKIICNDRVLVDTQRNIVGANVIECNTLIYRNLQVADGEQTETAARSLFSPVVSTVPTFDSNSEYIDRLQGDQNVWSEEIGSVTVGGQLNEASGEYSASVGGRYNESSGNDSVTLGGRENQSIGDCSVTMGASSIAQHDRTFVWNANVESPASTTANEQFVVGGNLVFKLPLSNSVKTHTLPDGYACWCWDQTRNTLCLKTKQNNVFYKTNLDTLVHEIKVDINPETNTVTLINPDDS